MPRALMEVTPLPGIFLCPSLLADCTVHTFFLCPFSVGWGRPFLAFVVRGSQAQITRLLFELLLDFDGISVGLPKDGMSKNSISV
jgi:hypothetical protein